MTSRVVGVLIGLFVIWTTVALRGIYLQIIPQARLEHLKGRQFSRTVTLQSRRGDILDRNGKELAISVPSPSVYADPLLLHDKKALSRKLSQILKIPQPLIYKKIKDPQKRFVWLKRQISEPEERSVRALGERGLAFKEESKRLYPHGPLLSPVLGFIGREGQGLEGLELKFHKHLSGSAQKMTLQRDARGRPLVENGWLFLKNSDGDDLFLTVDRDLQYYLEQELKNSMMIHQAEGAVGVVLDVKTSAILGMASLPHFDPEAPPSPDSPFRRNRPVTDSFEPGSTMKTFLIAGALRDGLLKPNSKIDAQGGKLKIGHRIISEAETDHKFHTLSVAEVLAFSSNVGSSKIALQMGPSRLYSTLKDFGFGDVSLNSSDFSGASRGILHQLPWSQSTLASVSFGHEMAATPLQIANAYASIANGGKLFRPYLIKSLRDNVTGLTSETQPEFVRQVISPQVASQMSYMLTMATAHGGTGENARIPGFNVAGKTGTAQKVNPDGRGYLPNSYISSFAGFFPVNDPRFVIYIAVDNPKKGYYGSQVAAPVFSNIAQFLVRREGLAPVVLSQKTPPKPGVDEKLPPEKLAIELPQGDLATMPELSGLSLRDVVRSMNQQEFKVEIFGSGRVVRTLPSAGEAITPSQSIKIYLAKKKDGVL